MNIVLASASPRRSELLREMGIKFDVIPADFDESSVCAPDCRELVRRLACGKAASALPAAGTDALIIAADTLVECDGERLGKPRDRDDARRMLRLLSGRKHYVHSGVALRIGEREVSDTVSTEVRFRVLSEREIDAYLDSGEPADKAGAYGIQGRGALFVTQLHGDFFSVMGLPLCRLGELAAELGVIL